MENELKWKAFFDEDEEVDLKETEKIMLLTKYGIPLNRKDKININKLPETEEEWLKGRVKYLGGSESSGILGKNPYVTPLSIYAAKVDGKRKDLSNVAAVQKGKDLEDFILQNKIKPKFPEYDIVKPEYMFNLKSHPYIAANLDGIAIPKRDEDDPFVIEIKYITQYGELGWEDGVPEYYWTQIQHYMHVVGIHKGIVFGFKESNWKLEMYDVAYDKEFCENSLIPGLITYWDSFIEPKIPPKATSKDTEYLKEEMNKIKEFKEDSSLDELVEKYTSIKDTIKDLNKEQNILKEEIIKNYTDGKIPSTSKFKVNLNVVNRVDLDSAKVKEEYPLIAKQFQKEINYSTLRVTKNKKEKK